MSEKPVISEKAWQLMAEAKIRNAMTEGDFLDLPGFGKPVSAIDDAVDAEMGWIKDELVRGESDALPPALDLKRQVARKLLNILELKTKEEVVVAVDQLNDIINSANVNIKWGPPSTTQPVELDAVLHRWKIRGNR